MPVRVPISAFTGVNLASVAEVALIFDQTASGSLFLADVELVRAPVSPRPTLSDPPSAELIAAAEAGDVEAMRQLANLYRPTDALGVQYGNLEQAIFWYRQACAAGYAVAQVDFYEFARTHAELHSDVYLTKLSSVWKTPSARDIATPSSAARSMPPSSRRITRRVSFSTPCSRGRNRTLPISAGVLPTS
jgi:TPR repeat protein